MAKKASRGLSYFNIDTTFFSDLKIRKLIKYQGGKAVTVYTYLLCNIYQEGYYMLWDDELPFMISESTGFDEAYIREVIKCCLNVGLFEKILFDKEGVLTSAGIQKRFEEVCIRSKRKFRVSEFNLINTEDIPISSEDNGINTEVMPINTEVMPQSKVKESKEKDINTGSPPDLSGSNLYRKPIIPTKQEVWEYFSRQGATKEMAKSFYDKHDGAGWFINGSPIVKWTALAGRFITNWKPNKEESGHSSAPPLKRA